MSRFVPVILFFGFAIFQNVMGLDDEMKKLAETLHKTCQEESSVSEESILNARTGNFADEENLKCYIKCVMEQMGCMDDDGTINQEAVISVLPEEFQKEAEPIIRTCGTKTGSNPCENAWLTHKCYYEQNPQVYFLV